LPRIASSPAPLFSALGDPTRLRLLRRLSGGGALSITSLTAGSRVTRQAVSKHLAVLSRAGLVAGARRGRESLWRLTPRPLSELRRWLDHLSRQWDGRLARLKEYVEG
jgi:DNA-binding transcriptional ArsR family regulator